ncbi:MAG: hypothetical protein GF330_10345 [Candidatus Eisenbacteria bacterium]|nr:hypothetical protein [Candidatus Eisenbacteria bacterium]
MYLAVLLGLLALALLFVIRGVRQERAGRIVLGLGIAAAAVLLFSGMGFWGEVLWFRSLGFEGRLWTEVAAKAVLGIGVAVLGWLLVNLLTLSLRRRRRTVGIGAPLLGGFIGLVWGLSHWDTALRFLHRAPAGIAEPILEQDAGFYLFSLPFYDALYTLVLLLAVAAVAANLAGLFLRFRGEAVMVERPEEHEPEDGRRFGSLYASSGVLLLVLASGKLLARYHLLYSSWGAVTGAGWTDVHVRLPAYAVAVAAALLGALAVLVPPVRRRAQARFADGRRPGRGASGRVIRYLGGVGAGVFVLWVLVLSVAPGLVQWLRVEPNEITLERPYIAHNIRFTREAFGLQDVEEHEYPATPRFDRSVVEANQTLFENIRLWDWRALDAVYKQFQEIRLYYEFADVDIDRYQIGDDYRQVMVAAREMELENLAEQSQTFVNRRFKYTHGYGITLAPVQEFTAEGLPRLLVKDIPPVSADSALEVTRPEIYYGELTRTPVVTNSEEAEFDYPRGEENRYTRYSGQGGVPLRNFWRKLLFGWKFDGTRFLLSGYPRPESRIQFHRSVGERVRRVAPFLRFDDDPYIVLADGHLYWIIDAYATSRHFPYSERFSGREFIEYRNGERTRGLRTLTGAQLQDVNYLRNSVKAVVDAYDGSIDFYVFEPDDPIIRVWQRIFPELFKAREEMPAALEAHVRYPADMLTVQGLVYAKYHMTDPTVFYNQEDLWIRATEKYYDAVQPVEPYYVMWEPPGADDAEFVLILPFTPKNRQVLIGWIAGMCDPGNYGRFLAYKFPKERRVIGPQQVETKIDQDSYLSGQLTLWDQRGSNVIRGNVLAIPVGETVIYVEPIYLQAETAAYPELRLVVMMHGDNLSYAETFDRALAGLIEGEPPPAMRRAPVGGPGRRVGTLAEEARRANRAFEDYLSALGSGDFQRAASALEQLQSALEAALRSAEEAPAPSGGTRP